MQIGAYFFFEGVFSGILAYYLLKKCAWCKRGEQNAAPFDKEKPVDFKQRTLKDEVGCTGLGLHSGEKIRIQIRPARSNTGIRFVRTDLSDGTCIDARFDNVFDTTLATSIGSKGSRVSTIEHLMAAFYGLGIDNAMVGIGWTRGAHYGRQFGPLCLSSQECGHRRTVRARNGLLWSKSHLSWTMASDPFVCIRQRS